MSLDITPFFEFVLTDIKADHDYEVLDDKTKAIVIKKIRTEINKASE